LKPSNILISATWRALIGDFGSSRFEADNATLTPEGGTVRYAAPEQFEANTACTPKVDVFSFGLILYELLVGEPVFPVSMSPFAVSRAHRDGTRPSIPDSVGAFMQQLIDRCWSTNPGKRSQIQEIVPEYRADTFAAFYRMLIIVQVASPWMPCGLGNNVRDAGLAVVQSFRHFQKDQYTGRAD
jgi:serine/threonine protein kinase